MATKVGRIGAISTNDVYFSHVSSALLFGWTGFDIVVPEGTGYGTSSTWQVASQRHTTWAHLALHAKDQLRQRVAWSLSQIIAVGVKSNGGSRVALEKTEPYLVFYDQFVRNGFGSYRDLMREFSYNVLMAEWLSFVENKSLQWNLMNGNGPNYPDENVRYRFVCFMQQSPLTVFALCWLFNIVCSRDHAALQYWLVQAEP